VAGPGATPDASPSAAVVLLAVATSVPGVEDTCRVSGDAMLEGQQGIPLVGYAGWAANTWMSCRLGLLGERMRVGDHGEEAEGGRGHDEQQVLGG